MADTNNAVLFGLNKVHYAIWNPEQKTYGTPKRIYGAVSLSMNREGESSTFYADDAPFYSTDSNGGYSGTLEIARASQEMLKDLLGEEVDANGMLLESTEDKQAEFALLFEVSSNAKNQRFVFFNCKLSRPESEANTKADTTEPDTQSLDITMIARELPYGDNGATKSFIKGSMELTETNTAAYNAFFTTVQVPTKA